MEIKRLIEELEKYTEEEQEEIINGYELVPHGEYATKYYKKALEYLKNHVEKVKRGFINLLPSELGLNIENVKSLGYEFK